MGFLEPTTRLTRFFDLRQWSTVLIRQLASGGRYTWEVVSSVQTRFLEPLGERAKLALAASDLTFRTAPMKDGFWCEKPLCSCRVHVLVSM